jgi:L-seryl-tRNA(Ser) seleniumtransferase
MPDFKSLPSVDKVMGAPALASFPERVRRVAARGAVARARAELSGEADFSSIVDEALSLASGLVSASLRPAINMSGVVLHTGLGRARLAQSAQDHVAAVAHGHSLLELDDETGARGNRQRHVEAMLCELTGAEAALVVNNCAAAVFLCLQALSRGREVLLSRGQMVEIGGSFRMPEIVRESGCTLVELGCTNKTRLLDYSKCVTSQTAAVLRCHPSNFQIVGFTEEPSARELAEFCHQHSLALIDDVGSGCLIETEQYGLPHERTLAEALGDGADVVTASGDKLLGGPQAGLVLGKRDVVAKIAAHPVARAVRVDKLTLAGLEATLRLYLQGRHAEVPVWRYLSKPLEAVRKDADQIASGSTKAVVEQATTEVGGGSMPGATVPTYRVGFKGRAPDQLAAALRSSTVPVVGYIADGVFWLDPRTAEADEVQTVADLVKEP